MDSVIVTGSGGLVGTALAASLGRPFEAVHCAAPDWQAQAARARFDGATVFHLAARVHRAGDADEAAYRVDNVEKTRALALAAARGGARRFVFLSTVKVHGEETRDAPFRPGDTPRPEDAYARSKLAAEQALAEAARGSALEVTVVRSPLVFGHGAAGNLGALLGLANSPWPLPFASIDNRRSFVHVDDLAALLIACASSPAAAGATFLAAHPRPFSTPGLIAALRRALERPARLFPVPAALLEAGAAVLGRGAAMRRLTRSLEVDATETTRVLGWRPQRDLDAAVADIASGGESGA